MNRFRTIALTAFAGLVLVACGPAASGSESDAGQASQPASQGAGASQDVIEPSFGEGVVGDLEALIPDTIGELTMQKSSMQGNEFLLDPDSDPTTVQFIQDVGVSPNNISMAIGYGFNADASSFAAMVVVRAEGADSNALLNGFKQAMAADASPPPEWTDASVGGKQVQVSGDDSEKTYLYAKGDVVVWITASDPAVAEEVLSGLR